MEATTPLWVWCALGLVVLFAVVVRLRLVEVPLERDEGEYAYMAQLILDGVPPYTQAFNMKLPGIYAAYALVLAVFGQTQSGIHLGLLLVNALTTLLVFLLARTWLRNPGALAAGAVFALLSLGQPVQGVFANAEHFVLPFAVSGLLAIRRAEGTGVPWARFVGAGSLLGVGVLMKQHGAAFAACGVVLAALSCTGRGERWRRMVAVAGGTLLPYLSTCAIFAATGTFSSFWFWTVRYAAAYSSQLPFAALVPNFTMSFRSIQAAAPLVWILAALGLGGVWLAERSKASAAGMLAYAGFSILAIVPGYFFRPHYFVLTLPAVAILAGAATQAVESLLARRWSVGTARAIALGLVVLAAGDAVGRQAEFLFRMTPHRASRDTYGGNPFPESIEIAGYIREHSEPGDRIAVLGSEPQILFYSRRRSVTGHIYAYGMMELHEYAAEMQREVIADIERERPKFIVFVAVRTSWLQRPGSATEIFRWFEGYSERDYRVVGRAEIRAGEATRYLWGESIPAPPAGGAWVTVMERR